MFSILVIIGYFLGRLPERYLDHFNQKALVKSRWNSIRHPVVETFYYVDLMLPILMLLLSNWHPPQPVNQEVKIMMLGLMVGGMLIRVLSMRSLGGQFRIGCQWVIGSRPVKEGPYRFVGHPDWCGRYLEGLGLASCLCFPYGTMFVLLSYPSFLGFLHILERRCRMIDSFDSSLHSTSS